MSIKVKSYRKIAVLTTILEKGLIKFYSMCEIAMKIYFTVLYFIHSQYMHIKIPFAFIREGVFSEWLYK